MLKRNIMFVLLSTGLGLINSWGAANNQAPSLTTTNNVEVVTFVPNGIIPLNGSPFYTTLIQFSEQEQIQAVTSGDAAAWMAVPITGKPNMLSIKATIENSETNMTVITNHRTYFFHLRSLSRDSTAPPTYAIHFRYPLQDTEQQDKQEHERTERQDALYIFDRYNWDYTFSGHTRIMPINVFDDGEFTFMRFHPRTPQPAVFAVDNRDAKESVLNVRREGDFLLIQRIAPQFTLRLGPSQVASIFNQRMISNGGNR